MAETTSESVTGVMRNELETVSKLLDLLVEFAVQYGFQILGALVFLFAGLKIAGWAGRRVAVLAELKAFDLTLSRFIGNVVKIVMVVFVVIITLGNFGISIAPLIALAGAMAFGATMAIQGPLSNYGAGLSIVLSRPFAVGDTITVKNISGTVNDIKLAATQLIGEDKERITIPNKEIVGQVIVNSHQNRIVEIEIIVDYAAETDKAIAALLGVLKKHPLVTDTPNAQVGVQDFTYGGVVIGLRFWVPSLKYFQTRFAVNGDLLKALRDADVRLLSAPALSMPVKNNSTNFD